MNEAYYYSREMIDEQLKHNRILNVFESFSKYSKGYLWTNENLKKYLCEKNISLYNSGLSVLGSGDHLFNLLYLGIKNVDTFDTNSLTEYNVFGLKKALIEKFSYQDFLIIMEMISNNELTLEETTYLIKDLLPLMDNKYRRYWDKIIEYNYKYQKDSEEYLDLFSMLFVNISESKIYIKRNGYLANEQNYDTLKANLSNANLTFSNVDAINIQEYFSDKKYDLIVLSNILDYICSSNSWNYADLIQYEERLLKLVNDNGTIFLAYLFNYYIKNSKYLFRLADIKNQDLTIEKLININIQQNDDALLLVRK